MVPGCRSGVGLPPPAGNVRFPMSATQLGCSHVSFDNARATGIGEPPNNLNILNPAVAANSAPSPERSKSKWQNAS